MGMGANFPNINDISELGSMIQRDPGNASVLRYRIDRFGVNQNGQVNLGMAQHLFFPNDMSMIQSARGGAGMQNASYMDQSSIQYGGTGSNFMSS